MKKRLREKLYRGEFRQYGIFIMITTKSIEIILNVITDIADTHKLLFCGGGFDRLVLPSEELEILSKVEFLVTSMVLGSDIPSDCIIGYSINPIKQEIPVDMADKVKLEFEKVLKSMVR